MANFNTDIQWTTSTKPKITYQVSYEKYRDGSSMYYKVYVKVNPLTGGSYFGYNIKTQVWINGEKDARYSGDIKANSPSQWSAAKQVDTGWMKLENKTSGSTGLKVRLYSTSASSRDQTDEFTMGVDPAYFSSTPSITYTGRTGTTLNYNWSTSEQCNWIRYHLNGGSGWTDVFSGSAKSGSFSVTGLSPGTTYKVYAECRREDSGLWSNSNELSNTTVAPISGLWISASPVDEYYIKLSNGYSSNGGEAPSWGQYQCHRAGEGWWNCGETVGPFNANETVYFRVGYGNSGGDTWTNEISCTTYDYPKPTDLRDFTIGNDTSVYVHNPLGREYALELISNNDGSVIGNYTGKINGWITGFGEPWSKYSSIPDKTSSTYYAKVTYGSSVKTYGNKTYSIRGQNGSNPEVPTFNSNCWDYTVLDNYKNLTGNDNKVVIGGYSTVKFNVTTDPTSNYSATFSGSNYGYIYTWADLPSAKTQSKTTNISARKGQSLKVRVYDDRGLYTDTEKNITNENYINYNKPQITAASTARKNGIDAETTLNLTGKLGFAGKFGPNGFTNTINSCGYHTRLANSDEWSPIYSIPVSSISIDTTTGEFSINELLIHANGSSDGFIVGKKYVVRVWVTDAKGLLSDGTYIDIDVTDGKIARDVYQDEDGNYHSGINGRANENFTEYIEGNVGAKGMTLFDGGDLIFNSSGDNDCGDIVFFYGNGKEKSRIWTHNTYNNGIGPNYRIFKEDGTMLYDGKLSTPLDNYPVGAIYMSAKITSPAELFGGEWVRLTGRYLFASAGTSGDRGQNDISSYSGCNVTGTAITVNQMPPHSHTISTNGSFTVSNNQGSGMSGIPCGEPGWGNPSYGNAHWFTIWAENSGAGWAHDHAVPYISVYVWQRIS